MRLLLISSSNVHGHGYLDHSEEEIRRRLGGVGRVGFVPFAAADHEGYIAKVRERLAAMELEVHGVASAKEIENADALFVGGGNTFRLLKTLYERNLIDLIRERVRGGLPYVGSSAGTVIACPTIRTTNDMPIVYPPTFDALGFVPFQVNPHYLDPDPHSTHKGETREERLIEYLEENERPVVGLREGSMIRVEDGKHTLVGEKSARILKHGVAPYEVEQGTVLDEHLAG